MAIACNNSFFWVTLVSLKDFRHEGLSWDFCRIQTLVDQDLPVYTRVGIIVLLLEAFFQSGPDFPLIELSWYWGGVVGASFVPLLAAPELDNLPQRLGPRASASFIIWLSPLR